MSSSTLTAAIKGDHEEMYEYYDNYKKATGDLDAQERWVRQLIWEVARHAVGEEIVVYPLMEQHLSNGLALANEDRAQHQVVKEQLYELEGLTSDHTDYHRKVDKIMKHLRPHNDSEEVNDLPELEKHLGPEGSAAAAASFKRTKKMVPTRAHPSAPNKPPFETLAGLMAAPVDKLKDMFAKFPTEEMKEQAK